MGSRELAHLAGENLSCHAVQQFVVIVGGGAGGRDPSGWVFKGGVQRGADPGAHSGPVLVRAEMRDDGLAVQGDLREGAVGQQRGHRRGHMSERAAPEGIPAGMIQRS
ncbi:hypothetical protein ACWDRX_20575 [Streptomyces nigra]